MMKTEFDVLIIGGGAAGLTAALSASKQGASVLVLEAAPRIGRKILASGNGRCNLANMGPPRYYGDEALARAVLKRMPVLKVLDFFKSLGLVAVEEEGGRVYPACGQAGAVMDVMRLALDRQGVSVLCDAPVKALRSHNTCFLAGVPQGEFRAKAVVAAFGGMAGGKLGNDGKGYQLLSDLGHDVTPLSPALSQLTAEKSAVRGLSGLRLPVILTLCDGVIPKEAAAGEALFTDYGLSGVCAMQLSRTAGEMLKRHEKPTVYIDFSPMLGLVPRVYDRVSPQAPFENAGKMQAFLKARSHMLPGDALLSGMVPRLLAEKLKGLPLPKLSRALCAYPVPITGVRGLEYAQVTAGGLDTRFFDPRTLSSRLCPGLYAAGEALNVDGDCGGFNLQFAFASGLIAGEEAALFSPSRL